MTKAEQVLFISDLHLSPDRPGIFQAFRDFSLNRALGTHALYILGDFFNLWIGDDNTDTFADQVSEVLQTLTGSGTRVFIMHGNRDFLLGTGFCERCGAELLQDPCVVEHFGQQFLLTHGDALCTRDTDYMAFRAMVRNSDWQRNFLARSLPERVAFAEEARSRSQTMKSNKAEDIMDVTPEEVVRLMTDWNQSILVHGHTHRPAIHDVALGNDTGKRIVLGDWDTRGWYLQVTPGKFELLDFPVQA